ncbi:MAG: 50S ribosomal protein L30 [Promethearchaeia archaeon]
MAKVKKKKKSKNLQDNAQLYFVVRIRGAPGMRRTILDTLQMLRMHKVNHGVLIWGEKSFKGMLQKCNNYITYGEIDEETLISLLRERGRIIGDRRLTDSAVEDLMGYESIEDFARALLDGEIQYKANDLNKIKPVFRLHPPRKGFKGTIKRHRKEGGALGYIGKDINQLIQRMI